MLAKSGSSTPSSRTQPLTRRAESGLARTFLHHWQGSMRAFVRKMEDSQAIAHLATAFPRRLSADIARTQSPRLATLYQWRAPRPAGGRSAIRTRNQVRAGFLCEVGQANRLIGIPGTDAGIRPSRVLLVRHRSGCRPVFDPDTAIGLTRRFVTQCWPEFSMLARGSAKSRQWGNSGPAAIGQCLISAFHPGRWRGYHGSSVSQP